LGPLADLRPLCLSTEFRLCVCSFIHEATSVALNLHQRHISGPLAQLRNGVTSQAGPDLVTLSESESLSARTRGRRLRLAHGAGPPGVCMSESVCLSVCLSDSVCLSPSRSRCHVTTAASAGAGVPAIRPPARPCPARQACPDVLSCPKVLWFRRFGFFSLSARRFHQ
jgi:hypothetical protein